jgi:hypothetical protein
MISAIAPYVTGSAAVAVLSGVFGLVRLRMRLRFNRYVVDKAVEQGQPVDALAIIKVTTPGASPGQDPATSKDSVDLSQA